MADEDDDLKLNTLNRFEKKSTRLALEEYSHCEVPAGCGGVVLRWTDPDDGVPALLLVAASGRVNTYLDGVPLETGRTILAYGEHVLAVNLEHAVFADSTPPKSGGLVSAIAGLLGPARPRSSAELVSVSLVRDEGRLERSALPGVASSGDGTWRVLVTENPPETWSESSFDDSGWAALVAAPAGSAERLPEDDDARWRFLDLERNGGRPLLLPGGSAGASRFYIRKRFTVSRSALTP